MPLLYSSTGLLNYTSSKILHVSLVNKMVDSVAARNYVEM